jgi:hypothetical protein
MENIKMKHNKPVAPILAATLALLISLISVGVALAHEHRTVGNYDVIIGFLNEPAYTGLTNSVDLRISDHQTSKPVEGLEKTLKAEAIFGASTMPLQLRARFGQPGAYLADLVPTKAGTYIFHITGNIQGQNVDEKFESGPNTFSDVEDLTALQFPQKVPAALDLATQVKAAQDAASAAQTFAYGGIGVGVLGLIVGAVALLTRRK